VNGAVVEGLTEKCPGTDHAVALVAVCFDRLDLVDLVGSLDLQEVKVSRSSPAWYIHLQPGVAWRFLALSGAQNASTGRDGGSGVSRKADG